MKATPFEQETTVALQRVRSAFAEVIARLPGPITKAAELQRSLKLDMKLSGKILKVVTAPTPLAAGRHVPGPSNMKAFLRAAERRGVPAEPLRAAAEAVEAFDQLVTTHAGDRSTFDTMISTRTTLDEALQVYVENKRAAFRAQRNILGMHAAAQLKTMLIQPAADPRLMDVARVEGFIGLRPLRADASLVISRWHPRNDDGAMRAVLREPLDREAGSVDGLALLGAFCSQPLPRIRTAVTLREGVHYELATDGVGNSAAMTCIEGYVARGSVPRYRQPTNRSGGSLAIVRIPSEVLIVDLLVREDTFEQLAPTVLVYSEHLSELPEQPWRRDRDRLRLDESLAFLGTGPAVLHTPHVPRYVDLAQYVLGQLGWEGDRFYAYRCCIDYPVIPSTVVVRFELPEEPSDPEKSA